MKQKIAVIGAGAIGLQHVEAARAIGTAVGYVVDTDLERAERLASLCNAQPVTDANQVWHDTGVTAVIVAVPNFHHKPITIAALQARKDVLLEKPMSLNSQECDEIIKAANDCGRIVQIGMVHRYTAVGESAIQIGRREQLGRLYHIKAHLYQRRGVPGLGGWFTTKRMSGGGVLIDIGVHLLDLALCVAGFPRIQEVSGKVYSTFGVRMQDYIFESMWAGPPNYEGTCDVEDAAHAFIRCAAELTLEVNVTWAGNFPNGVLPPSMMGFFGTKAGMTFPLFGDAIRLAKEEDRRNVDTVINLTPKAQFAGQLSDFLRATETRKVTGATMHEGRLVQNLVDMIYQSSAENRALRCGTDSRGK